MAFSFPTSVKRRTDCLSMILAEDVAEQHMLAWRQELGELDPNNPLVTPAVPWDAGSVFAHGTFAHDPIDGLWKAWHVSTPLTAGYFENYRRVTYLTSEDGVEWTRPELDLCPQPGYPRTNILLDFDSGGPSMYSSVMIDPDAEPDRRYEMFVMRDPTNTIGGGPGHIRGLPPPPPGEKQARGMYRYFSPDGINWTVSEGPVLEVAVPGVRLVIPYENPKHTADTTYVFRDADGTYFATHKLGEPAHPGGLVAYDIFAEGRRVMARRTSPDGSEWSPFETIIQPDIYDPHDVQIMELCVTPVRSGYIGVIAVYLNRTQTIELQLGGSADGRIWDRRVRLPAVAVGALGDYGGGMLWPSHHMVEHNGRHYVYFSGTEGLHGDPAAKGPTIWPFFSAICRASWAVNRYWAAVSGPGGDVAGTLTTHPLPVGGQQLILNAATSTVTEGELHAELLDSDGNVVEGFGKDDFIPWRGDSTAAPARWTGGDVCPLDECAVRFHLLRSRLYGYAWE